MISKAGKEKGPQKEEFNRDWTMTPQSFPSVKSEDCRVVKTGAEDWPTSWTFLSVKTVVAAATQLTASKEAEFTQGNAVSGGVTENQT